MPQRRVLKGIRSVGINCNNLLSAVVEHTPIDVVQSSAVSGSGKVAKMPYQSRRQISVLAFLMMFSLVALFFAMTARWGLHGAFFTLWCSAAARIGYHGLYWKDCEAMFWSMLLFILAFLWIITVSI